MICDNPQNKIPRRSSVDFSLKEEKLFYDRVKKLSEHTIRGVAASLINPTVLVVVLWETANKNNLLLWSLGIILDEV
jgi:hypothetical protein